MKKIALFVTAISLPLLVVAQTFVLPDSNFRNCLRDRYPSVLTTNGELDIAQAAKISSIVCYRKGIVSVDGLEYFTGIKEINLNINAIQSISNISKLANLQVLSIATNRLAYLPDLSKLKRLKELYVDENELKVLPDLSMNDSLQRLDVHSNGLDTLPYLGNLVQLRYLNILINRIRTIPGVEKLKSLTTLVMWKNNVSYLPPLTNLPFLTIIDASQNEMLQLPILGKNKIKNLYFDRNNLSFLPDFSLYDSITSVRLYGNNLAFKELLKIISKPGYDTIFKIYPQKTFLVGKQILLTEKDQLLLATGIDKGIAGVVYEWYKNGKLCQTLSKDTFSIEHTSLSDSGLYTCQIKHPSFSGFSLQTDTFFVRINSCISFQTISTTVLGINCFRNGSLTVSGLVSNNPNLLYNLKSVSTNKQFTSSTGTFEGLTESIYTLTVRTKSGCEKTYPSKITLPQEPCKEAYITPNNDGDTDSIFFPQAGKVTIYDKRGIIVKTFSIPHDWDGTAQNGLVPQGYYTADVNNGQEIINISVMY